ncbi:MAG: helix-turn-helix domain-containing protein [Candidatus Dormiibacterota bacterium]
MTSQMTPKEAAERLGVSTDTVVRWMGLGILTGWRLPTGGRRVDPQSVEAVAERSGMPRLGGSLSPSDWLRREVSSGRLAETPPDELLATIVDALRGRAAPVLAGVDNNAEDGLSDCAAGGSTSPAALEESTCDADSST